MGNSWVLFTSLIILNIILEFKESGGILMTFSFQTVKWRALD